MKPDVYVQVVSGGAVIGSSGVYQDQASPNNLPFDDDYLITEMNAGISFQFFDKDIALDDQIGTVTIFPRKLHEDSEGALLHTISENNIEFDIIAAYTEE